MKDLEDIINEVGGQGKYQKRLLYLVLSPLFFLLPLSWMSEVFYLNVPDHWCYHPMTHNLNNTELAAWKECFLIKNNDGSYDGCNIPLPNVTNIDSVWNMTLSVDAITSETCAERKWDAVEGYDNQDTINATCRKGWMFDKSEFTRTIPTDQNWFCDEEHDYVADLYTYGQAGSIIGGIVFSYIADRFGRRLTFWITTAIICVLMTVKTFLLDYYSLYVILKLVAAACYISTYQLPATLVAEVADPSYRSWTILVSWITW
jgi:OCT family organic cation transporter-like MFS transporter 4/5